MDALSEAAAVWEGELEVCEAAIGRWPKGFQVWHHRRFVMQTLLALLSRLEGAEGRARGMAGLRRELQCLERHLTHGDGKNHHAWTYRCVHCEAREVYVSARAEASCGGGNVQAVANSGGEQGAPPT